MRNADQIKNALDLLRQSGADAGASPFAETRLRAVFREQHAAAKPKASPRWVAWRFWAGAALAGLVAGMVVYRVAMPDSVQAPQNLPPVAIRQPITIPAPTQQPLQAESGSKLSPPQTDLAGLQKPKSARPAGLRPVRRSEPIPATMASSPQDEAFLAIPYAPPMMAQDRGEVVRVRLPRQSLRQFGIPVNPERMLERVPADLLVGEDGIPRGIRFVSVKEGR